MDDNEGIIAEFFGKIDNSKSLGQLTRIRNSVGRLSLPETIKETIIERLQQERIEIETKQSIGRVQEIGGTRTIAHQIEGEFLERISEANTKEELESINSEVGIIPSKTGIKRIQEIINDRLSEL